jgi:hypothetical protein
MSLAARTQALLDLVERERAQQCQALLDEARRAAATQRASSRAEARQRVREAFAEERARCAARLAAAHADLRTRRRAQAQRHLEAMLALAWRELPEALAARWQDADARGAWAAAALANARRALTAGAAARPAAVPVSVPVSVPASASVSVPVSASATAPSTQPTFTPAEAWQVTHAPGWPERERAACHMPHAKLNFVCDDTLRAGLRIAAGGNVLDATLAGLLADRAEIGGRLVGALEAAGAEP